MIRMYREEWSRGAITVDSGSRLVSLGLVLAASGLVALLARLSIFLPFSPVPMTGQTLGVLLAGAALGGRGGMLAMLAYLAEGAVGLPVFAGGAAGLGPLLGPTGGYLLAFPLAAGLVGFLVERFGIHRRVVSALASMVVANLLIYLLGLLWLWVWSSAVGRSMSVGGLLWMGFWPFLPGDAVKAVLAAVLLPGTWHLLQRFRGVQ